MLSFTMASLIQEMTLSLHQIFQKIGFVIIVLSWLMTGNDKRADGIELLKKLTFIFFTVSAIFYFPKIINSGMLLFQNIASAFKQDHEVVSKTIQTAVLNMNGGWFGDFSAGLASFLIDIGTAFGSGLSQLIYLFGDAMSVFIICVAPMMIACVSNENFKSLGFGFLKYSAIIMMIPLGIMIFDFLHISFLKFITQIADSGFNDPNVSGPGLVLRILDDPDAIYDKGALDDKVFGLGYLTIMGLTSGIFGVATICSPYIVYKLYGTGDISGVASQIGGIAQSAVAPVMSQMRNLSSTVMKSGPGMSGRTAGLIGMRGTQGMANLGKKAISSASRRLLGRSSPQSAKDRKPKY